jgi:hypothetical protein
MNSKLRAEVTNLIEQVFHTLTSNTSYLQRRVFMDRLEQMLDPDNTKYVPKNWEHHKHCQQCQGVVEPERNCYAVPMCYACLPPPPELEVITYDENVQAYQADNSCKVNKGYNPPPVKKVKPPKKAPCKPRSNS